MIILILDLISIDEEMLKSVVIYEFITLNSNRYQINKFSKVKLLVRYRNKEY